LRRILDVFEQSILRICAFLMLVIAIVVLWQVISRYIAGTSATWAPEVAAIAFIWLSMLAIAVGMRGHKHLRIDIVGSINKSRWLALVQITVAGIVVISSLGALAYYGTQGLQIALSRTLPGTGLSFAVAAFAVPVGAAIGMIFAVETFIRDLKRREMATNEADEAALI